jgi:uncharacterized paraquat-inducible protein A
MGLESDARCAAHPDAPATALCHRCGAFLCAACSRPYGRDALCPVCATRLALAPEVSLQAWVAFGLGIAGLACGLLLPGVAAWVLATRELRRIDAGTAPPGGRTYALAARILGIVCTGTLLLLVLCVLSWRSGR